MLQRQLRLSRKTFTNLGFRAEKSCSIEKMPSARGHSSFKKTFDAGGAQYAAARSPPMPQRSQYAAFIMICSSQCSAAHLCFAEDDMGQLTLGRLGMMSLLERLMLKRMRKALQ